MKQLLLRWKHNLPKRINDVWYNQSAHARDVKYPIIFDENKRYIRPKKGLKVVMNELPDGRKVYYEITRLWSRSGDWLYDFDGYDCNLTFSHIEA